MKNLIRIIFSLVTSPLVALYLFLIWLLCDNDKPFGNQVIKPFWHYISGQWAKFDI
jgi:hypothetical protein